MYPTDCCDYRSLSVVVRIMDLITETAPYFAEEFVVLGNIDFCANL